ncbi:hypothetical protein [Allosalinactinospora lopnorensis]|nr:hypothetical protein [Allosalinactinospora lopnorensis]
MPSTVGDLMTSRVIAVSENAEFRDIAIVLRGTASVRCPWSARAGG